MKFQDEVEQFYRNLTISQLRMANSNCYDRVSYNSLLYLDLISYTENCTVSMLADLLHVAKSAVTQKVKELERIELVTKTQSTSDKRVFYLHVNRGLLADYAIYDRVLDEAIDEIEKKYTPEQLGMLSDALHIISRHFAEASKQGAT